MAEGKFPEDSKFFINKENADDDGITMLDVLEREQELEEQELAVLGGSDDKNCTFPSGYIKRQALYACGTCSSNGKTLAGVCLACSFACHEGHRLFELYTKRNFRCDCGNSKFGSNPCKLFPDKDPFNLKNHYNQNFRGTYCTCARPYPDPDDEIEDEMIQCVACEDWYHGRHIGIPVPLNNDYEEMICGRCMCKYDFLWPYSTLTSESMKSDFKAEDVDVEHDDENESGADSKMAVSKNKRKRDEEKLDTNKAATKSGCFLEEIANNVVTSPGSAVYWPDGWRKKLCRCSNCMTKYSDHKVSFLLDDEDTVHSYEERGKSRNAGQSCYDQGMQALSQLDRVKQVEAISEYNDMKGELKDFLKAFADNKKSNRYQPEVSAPHPKSRRKKKFDPDEDALLLTLMEPVMSIIEAKTNTLDIRNEKNTAWVRIAREFNASRLGPSSFQSRSAVRCIPRDVAELKKRWDNLKVKERNAKKAEFPNIVKQRAKPTSPKPDSAVIQNTFKNVLWKQSEAIASPYECDDSEYDMPVDQDVDDVSEINAGHSWTNSAPPRKRTSSYIEDRTEYYKSKMDFLIRVAKVREEEDERAKIMFDLDVKARKLKLELLKAELAVKRLQN